MGESELINENRGTDPAGLADSKGKALGFRGQGALFAFTLIELLVVIAIITILAAMLLPVFATGKKKAQGIACMNNSKQLSMAVQMYTGEYHDFFPPNPDDGNEMEGYNWCAARVAGGIGNIPPVTNTFNPDVLRDPQISLITPYISKVVDIFRCPADPRRGAYSGTNPSLKGQIIPAARSISLNQGVGTVDPAYDEEPLADNHNGVPDLSVNGPWLNGKRTHHRNSPYATYGKTSEFGRSGAGTSQIFLTVDENPWSINDAAFAVSAAIPEWVDWPATFHDNACGFSFCDGHAEIHKWLTGSLFLDHKPKITVMVLENADWNWLAAHSTVKLY